MAGSEGPSSASPRSNAHHRTSSSHSAGKAASGGPRTKTAKTHTVGKHNRNPSFPRNLNKLARLAGSDDLSARPQRPKSTYTPSGSPSTTHVRRNKSDVALPRTGSKVQIKKNQSAVALRRNESASRLKRLSRPTTPREDEDAQLKGHAQPAFGFGSDDEDEDEDEWTEESASQSPTVTRNGSMKGPRPKLQSHDTITPAPNADARTIRGDSPTTPIVDTQRQPLEARPSNPPDPTVITNRLLDRTPSSHQLAPKLSTISAGGSSGTQSPANIDSNGASILSSQLSMPGTSSPSLNSQRRPVPGASIPSNPSLGKDGVSRFLDPQAAASSSGKSASALHNAMGILRTQESRSRSPSPNPATASAPSGEGVRRAKSAVHLSERDQNAGRIRANSQQRGQEKRKENDKSNQGHSRSGSLDDDPRAWTVTVDPLAHRRAGGNTQAKLELWRTQAQAADAEPPSVGPPAPLMRSMHGGPAASGYLGVEERRVRMAEEAENELSFLRVFRNPANESAERVRRERRKKKREIERSAVNGNGLLRSASKAKENEFHDQFKGTQDKGKVKAVGKGRPNTAPNGTSPNSTSNGASSGSVGSGGTTINAGSFEPHTPSRRSVRFDVGSDEHAENETAGSLDEDQRLANLLRSMWEGAEAEIEI